MPYPELHLIAIDPGGTTGWIRLTIPRACMYGDADSEILEWDAGQVTGSLEQQTDKLATYIRSTQGLSYKVGPGVVVEGFEYDSPVAGDEVMSPVYLLGMLRFARHRKLLGDAQIVVQSRGLAKSTATDSRLKKWGFWMEGEEHARDAARHAITALRRARAKESFRDQLWARG